MSLSKEIQQKIAQFAKEQSQYYLDAAEMTYMEKLRQKANQMQRKFGTKLSKFKHTSGGAREAQDDMVLYMSDFMNDLMSRGLSEQEAFAKAKEELAASSESDAHDGLQERLQAYYQNRDLATYEAIGLFYSGFLFVGLVVGALIGYVLSGGRQAFMGGGWIDAAIGAAAGMLLGLGFGLICNGILTAKQRK